MTTAQAARRWGVSQERVRQFLQEGRVQGAIKPGGDRLNRPWIIPDDAVRPPKMVRAPLVTRKMIRAKPARIAQPTDDPLLYVCEQHMSMSVRWIARALGITTHEVRRLYDQGLAMGIVCEEE